MSQHHDRKYVGGRYPVTPDGRYFVVRHRLWRMANPDLAVDQRDKLVRDLMTARRDVGAAVKSKNSHAEQEARSAVDQAKRALGERGPVWWKDNAPDLNRRPVDTGPYAAWYALLTDASDKSS